MSDLSVYAANQFNDWLSQGTIDAAPSNIYVTVFDSGGTELDGDLSNARASTTAGTDWNENGTSFTNANDIDLGEAAVDISNVDEIALYDAATGGNELARYTLADSTFDLSAGTNLIFDAGEIDFDVIDRTQ
jgi:hypothetical protein